MKNKKLLMKGRQITLSDVAHESGVSLQTVSRVLNNPDMVSQRTCDRVMEVMNTLHYVPNRSAQLLAGKAIPGLGLITASLTFHAPSQITAAIKRYAEEKQLQVFITMPKAVEYGILQAIFNEFRTQNIRGVIINVPIESNLAERLVRENDDLACLFLDVPPETEVSCVRFDHRAGATACVNHLWELGHRQFGLLAGPASSISARLRLGCWREALHGFGVTNAITAWGDWSASSGWTRTFELIHANPHISAIIVANDQMALGVLSALAQLKRIGAQAVSVTGYDDTADSLYFQPPLTTVAQDFNLLGLRAVEHIQALMHQPERRVLELLSTQLVVRQSTSPHKTSEPSRELLEQIKLLVNQL